MTLREALPDRSTRSARDWRTAGFSTIADMRGGSASPRPFLPSVDGAGRKRGAPARHDRAFASVANKGIAVVPYGIHKVVTADGRQLYQSTRTRSECLSRLGRRRNDRSVAVRCPDRNGRAAQIGRPVAEDRTTSSNKDGWFIGFSSGLTTGVWMGRDEPPGCRAPGWHGTRAGLSRLHGCRGCQSPGRAIRYRGTDAGLAADTRRGAVG